MHFSIKTLISVLLSGSVYYGSGIESSHSFSPNQERTSVQAEKINKEKETPKEYRDRKIRRVIELNLLTEAETGRTTTVVLDSILRDADVRRFTKRRSTQPLQDYSVPKPGDSRKSFDAEHLLKQADKAKQQGDLVEVIRCCNEVSQVELVDADTLYTCIELLISISQRDESLKSLCQKALRKRELTSGKRQRVRITLIDMESDLEVKKRLVEAAMDSPEICRRPHLMLELGEYLLDKEEIFRETSHSLLQQAGELSNETKVIIAAIKLLWKTDVNPEVCLSLAKRIKNSFPEEANVLAQLFLEHGKIDEAVEVFKGQSLSVGAAVRFFPEWMWALINKGAVNRVIEIYKLVIRENQDFKLASKILGILSDLAFSTSPCAYSDRVHIMELLSEHDTTPWGKLTAMGEILKANRLINFTDKHYEAFKHFSITELTSFLGQLLEIGQIDESIEIVQKCGQHKSKIDALMYLTNLSRLKKETKVKLYKKIALIKCAPKIKFHAIEVLRGYGKENDDSVRKICLQIADDPDASYEDLFKAAAILGKIDPEAAKAIYLQIADDPEANYEDVFRAVSFLGKIDPQAAKVICLQISDDPEASYEDIFRAASLLKKTDPEAAKAIYLQLCNDSYTPEHIRSNIKNKNMLD